MFEAVVQKIVDSQIKSGGIKESERSVYLYGYQMLIEFCINIITSILIAFIFRAYGIVVMFTVAFLLIRGYAGGYHAKTSLGCFCWSASILIISVMAVKLVVNLDIGAWLFLLEVIILPCVFHGTPIPNRNKPITENERLHFNRKVKQIYFLELLVELFLLFQGLNTLALSILAVHVVLFIMVFAGTLPKKRHQK